MPKRCSDALYVGFRRHVDIVVAKEGDRPSKETIKAARVNIGCGLEPAMPLMEEWFFHDGRWWWVYGIKEIAA